MAYSLVQQPPAMNAFIVGSGKNSSPSAEEETAIQRAAQSGGLRAIYALDNRRQAGDGNLEGTVYEFETKAVIRGTSPLFTAPDRLFGHVLVAAVRNNTVDESLVRKKIFDLKENIHVRSTQPFNLQHHLAGPYDGAPWTCELGRHGHFVGLHKEETERALPSYYVVVHTDAGQVGVDLVEKFVKPKIDFLTYEDLLESREYKKAALYSHRNARRLLADVADHLGLDVNKMSDPWAKVDESRFDAPPDLGMEQSDTEYNMLRRVSRPHGESIVFYSRCSHLGSCTGARVAYLVDPGYGVVLYKGDPERENQGSGVFANAACSAFPIGTGRITSAEVIEANRRQMTRDRATREFMNLIVHWKGRNPGDPVVSHERIGAYADFSEQRRAIHAAQLGAQYGHVRLKPVCIVIAPPLA